MSLTLIGACRSGENDVPRALLPLAGMPLAEHQARRAAAAGATPILLLIEMVTPEFAALIGRLRADGIAADMIETIADAGRYGNVLLLADGCLPAPELIVALLTRPAPCVATIADGPGLEAYERIDAHARWAGVALITQGIVAGTATILNDGWDPVSTLLRRAVQEDAARLDAVKPPLTAERADDLIDAEQALIVTSRLAHDDWIAQRLFTPIEDRALPWLLDRQVEPALLAIGTAIAAVLAGLAALLGLRWPVLIMLLLVGPAASVAVRLARMQSRQIASRHILDRARRAGGAVALLGLGWSLMSETGQWGWLLVAGIAIAALSGLAAERKVPAPRWHATARTLAWEMLPFALLGRWGLGLAALALHASLSFAAALAARRTDQRLSSGM